jgi:hypothetical protein
LYPESMPTNTTISIDQLKRAIVVAEQIEALQAELNQILGGQPAPRSTASALTPTTDSRKGKRSPAVKARMAAAQKARWAAKRGAASEPVPVEKPKKRKGGMSAAGRAAIIAAQKARWARVKAAKGSTPEVVGHLLKVETLRPAPVMKAGPGKSIPLSELKVLLEAAPEKTLNIRREGLQLRNIKVLAGANPHLLALGGSGPWPTVTMLK